jgi:abortive infection bacteriophage resistance protein
VPGKPPLSVINQIERLVARGLDVPDEDARLALARLLTDNSYSRLARYWRYAQNDRTCGDKSFRPAMTVTDLADSYRFDTALRLVMTEGLSEFEITLRSRLGYFMAANGATWSDIEKVDMLL